MIYGSHNLVVMRPISHRKERSLAGPESSHRRGPRGPIDRSQADNGGSAPDIGGFWLRRHPLEFQAGWTPFEIPFTRAAVRHRPRPRGRVRYLTAARFRGRALARFFVSAGRRQKNKTGKNPWADFFPPSRRGRRKGLPFFCFCSPKGEPNKRASHVCEALCFGVLYGFF